MYDSTQATPDAPRVLDSTSEAPPLSSRSFHRTQRLEERVCHADFQLYLVYTKSAERGQDVRFAQKTRDEPKVYNMLQDSVHLKQNF